MIKFRNFIPKDEELRQLIVQPVTVDCGSLQAEFEAQVTLAKESLKSVSKKPSSPNWDLKRDFALRQKKINVRTNRAIAELCGKEVLDMDEEPIVAAPIEEFNEEDLVQLSSDDEDFFPQISRDDLDIHDE